MTTFTKPPIKNLSVSRIEKAMLCPKHYKLKVIDKIPEPASWVAHGGIVVHGVIEDALKTFGRTGKHPSWQEMDDHYTKGWNDQQLKTEGKDDFIGWKDDPKEPPEKVMADCRPLVRLAREEALPRYRPWILDDRPVVEYRLDLELESAVGPFPIIGYMDLLDDSGAIVDWKTTSPGKDGQVSQRKLKGWLQNAAYSLWAWPIVGEEVVRCQKVFLVKGPTPRVEYSNFTVGPKQRKFFLEVASEVWRMTVQGGFPANTNTWMCRPDFCSYYQVCRGEIDSEIDGELAEEIQGETPAASAGEEMF
jgi:CRISPR/Cas system-associated exonuclease Cas4 (RecB family)